MPNAQLLIGSAQNQFASGCFLETVRMNVLRFCLFAMILIVGFARKATAADLAAPAQPFKLSMTVELGNDRGQAVGSLFELVDDSGKTVAGAGFLSAYNTQPRSDRQLLQFFLKPSSAAFPAQATRLPAISEMSGSYPFSVNDTFYTVARGGSDTRVRRWNPPDQKWVPDDVVVANEEQVANRRLSVTSNSISYDGHQLLQFPPDSERIGEHYFADGQLIVRQFAASDPPTNRFVVYPWNPAESTQLTARPTAPLELRSPREFVYAFGQLRNHVIAATNTGGVYRYDGGTWSVLREPSPGVSFQIYTAINYYDRLLFGQYPTGDLFEYDGEKLFHLANSPPVLKGVTKNARELQTLAIYGGELYAGVWPWGEVWRFDGDRNEWNFVQRMFDHPELTDSVTHPYEKETKQVDDVFNLWGQRVTGMVPFQQSLMITTSSKGGNAWQPKFDFLSPSQRSDYGAAYQLVIPGQLAVASRWVPEHSTFEFRIADHELTIDQDGTRLGSLKLTDQSLSGFKPHAIRWGRGVFGAFAGKIHARSTSSEIVVADTAMKSPSTEFPHPLRAAYIHPERHFTARDSELVQQTAITQMLDRMQTARLNAIFPFFTGSSGQAFYASEVLPIRTYPDNDPLKYMVSEAHARGIKVYPVMCVAICGNEKPAEILLQKPDWGLRHPDGSPLGYISPANPDARAWLASVASEIVTRYPVDGIVYDYLRYHNRPLRLDVAAEERFKQTLPAGISEIDERTKFQEFKEAQVTELARSLSTAVRNARPDARIAMYSWGPHVTKNHQIAQVWPVWVERGYLDMVNVSGYYHRETYADRYLSLFEQRMSESLAIGKSLSRQVPITFALGVNTSHGRVHSAMDIRDYLELAAKLNMQGVSFFTWNDLLPFLDEL